MNYYEGISVDNRHRVRELFEAQAKKLSAVTPNLIGVSDNIVCVSHSNSSEDINVSRTHTIGRSL